MNASRLTPPRKFLWPALLSIPLLFCALPQQAAAESAQTLDKTAIVKQACGSKSINFDVKLDDTQHELTQPNPQKALVYFIQDLGLISTHDLLGAFTTKVGMDGAWIGAVQNYSYFSVYVAPGEHHFCVNPQSHFSPGREMEFAPLMAEAGRVYYFRIRQFSGYEGHGLEFDQTNRDQALYMIASYPQSVSKPK